MNDVYLGRDPDDVCDEGVPSPAPQLTRDLCPSCSPLFGPEHELGSALCQAIVDVTEEQEAAVLRGLGIERAHQNNKRRAKAAVNSVSNRKARKELRRSLETAFVTEMEQLVRWMVWITLGNESEELSRLGTQVMACKEFSVVLLETLNGEVQGVRVHMHDGYQRLLCHNICAYYNVESSTVRGGTSVVEMYCRAPIAMPEANLSQYLARVQAEQVQVYGGATGGGMADGTRRYSRKSRKQRDVGNERTRVHVSRVARW